MGKTIEVNDNVDMAQGIKIIEEPYSVKWEAEGWYKIYFRKTFVGSGRDLHNKNVPASLELLNDAYQKGYHNCSVELLNAKTS